MLFLYKDDTPHYYTVDHGLGMYSLRFVIFYFLFFCFLIYDRLRKELFGFFYYFLGTYVAFSSYMTYLTNSILTGESRYAFAYFYKHTVFLEELEYLMPRDYRYFEIFTTFFRVKSYINMRNSPIFRDYHFFKKFIQPDNCPEYDIDYHAGLYYNVFFVSVVYYIDRTFFKNYMRFDTAFVRPAVRRVHNFIKHRTFRLVGLWPIYNLIYYERFTFDLLI